MILIFAIFLVVALFIHDMYLQGIPADPSGVILISWIVPPFVLAATYLLACRGILKRLRAHDGTTNLQSLERITRSYLLAAAAIYACDLFTGLLRFVRTLIGDFILLDELLVMTIPIALVCWSWWAYYPIDRHRKKLAKTQAILPPDIAPPGVHAPPTRMQFVVYHLRLQLAIVLVPLLFMTGLQEALGFLHDAYPRTISPLAFSSLHLLGVGCVLLFAPVALRYIWDTAPLPQGELRDRLLDLCKSHRVGVRQLLVWKTYGAMINGAVMGLIAPLRFILLTDSLIERLPQAQIEAVMAHELAHVKRGHILWLFLTTACSLSMLTLLVNAADWYFFRGSTQTPLPDSDSTMAVVMDALSTVLVMGAWWAIFGWVSRRFERQADTFAVQHSAMKEAGADGTGGAGPVVISDNAARTMIDALETVAVLNNIAPKEAVWRQWRHGSIRWRQFHLFALVGRRADQLPIDRTVRRIKMATTAMLCTLLIITGVEFWTDSQRPKPDAPRDNAPTQAVGAPLKLPVAKPDSSPIMKPASQL